MQILYVLLIILLVSLYKAEECIGSPPNQPTDCHNREKSNENQYKCCYIYKKIYARAQIEKEQRCTPFTKDEFDNIKDIMKSFRAGISQLGGIIEAYNVDCSSNYLYISLVLLMIFLF